MTVRNEDESKTGKPEGSRRSDSQGHPPRNADAAYRRGQNPDRIVCVVVTFGAPGAVIQRRNWPIRLADILRLFCVIESAGGPVARPVPHQTDRWSALHESRRSPSARTSRRSLTATPRQKSKVQRPGYPRRPFPHPLIIANPVRITFRAVLRQSLSRRAHPYGESRLNRRLTEKRSIRRFFVPIQTCHQNCRHC